MADYPRDRSFVDTAMDAIRESGFVCMDMGSFAAAADPPSQVCADAVTSCDIYIGIIGMKWGSRMQDHSEEVSYTEFEFRTARKAQIPCLIFLLHEEAVLPVSAVHDPEHGSKQENFRNHLKNAGLTYCFFRSAEELHRRLKETLGQLRNDSRPRVTKDASARLVPDDYAAWLLREYSSVSLLGLRPKEGHSIRLNSVYVPLTSADTFSDMRATTSEAILDDDLPDPLLLNLVGLGSLYLTGDAGTGKSTFCRWISILLALNRFPGQSVSPPVSYQEGFPPSLRGRLPLHIPLRQFWEHLPLRATRSHMSIKELDEALASWIDEASIPDLNLDLVRAHRDHGTLLLILDGMDEVPRSFEKCSPRAMLIDGLSRAIPEWTTPDADNRILLTSRPYGLAAEDLQRIGIAHFSIADLPEPLQQLLAHRWFAILESDPETGSETASVMLRELSDKPDCQFVRTNPLLLTATCIVFSEGRRLPQDKYELYDRIVDRVLYNRFPRAQRTIDLVRNELAVVAHGMHTGEGLDLPDQMRVSPQAEVRYDDIDRLLKLYHNQGRHTLSSDMSVVEAREQLLSETGLLLPRSHKRATFQHLSFQEFFAGQRLFKLHETTALFDVFCRRAPSTEWHNTLYFVFGAIFDAALINEPGCAPFRVAAGCAAGSAAGWG